MEVDYNDERFQQIERDKQAALNENQTYYDNMINEASSHYKNLENQVADAGKRQEEIQQQQTDFNIQQLNQQKEWAQKDYEKEQKASYVDYMKQKDEYGANADQLAASGLSNSGFSETSRVSMWNAYQNRYATARESFNRATVEYDAQISQARLTNNANLANIAAQTLKDQLSLALEGFQYKNSLLTQQLNAKNDITNNYYSRWKDTLAQINYENELKEQQRQFEEQMALQKSKSSGGSGRSGGGGSYYTFTKDGVVYNQDGEIVGYEDGNNGSNANWFIDGQGRVWITDANGNVVMKDPNETTTSNTSKKSSNKSSSKSKSKNANQDAINNAIRMGVDMAYNPTKTINNIAVNNVRKGIDNVILSAATALGNLVTKSSKKKK